MAYYFSSYSEFLYKYFSIIITITSSPQVCQEAAMGPIRELGPAALLKVRPEDVRALTEVVCT